jgi:hypothetical protein
MPEGQGYHPPDDMDSLRAELPGFVLGTLVMAVGLGSLALAIARRADRDLLLVSFAAFAGLHSAGAGPSLSSLRPTRGNQIR